jgi:hypothetical protein
LIYATAAEHRCLLVTKDRRLAATAILLGPNPCRLARRAQYS